jgi:hypothetical protein
MVHVDIEYPSDSLGSSNTPGQVPHSFCCSTSCRTGRNPGHCNCVHSVFCFHSPQIPIWVLCELKGRRAVPTASQQFKSGYNSVGQRFLGSRVLGISSSPLRWWHRILCCMVGESTPKSQSCSRLPTAGVRHVPLN